MRGPRPLTPGGLIYRLGQRPPKPSAWRKTDVIGWLLARSEPFTVTDLSRGLGMPYDLAAAYISKARVQWGMLDVEQQPRRMRGGTGRRIYRKVT